MAAKVDTSGSPLSAADLKLINAALYKASQAVEWLDAAERAGLDVSNERLVHADTVTRLTAIKQTYFPGVP